MYQVQTTICVACLHIIEGDWFIMGTRGHWSLKDLASVSVGQIENRLKSIKIYQTPISIHIIVGMLSITILVYVRVTSNLFSTSISYRWINNSEMIKRATCHTC
jgi:hypothetical protein